MYKLSFLFLIFSIFCKSQTSSIEYTYNFLDQKTIPVYKFWKQYVEYRATNNELYKSMWKEDEQDLIISASGFNPNLYEMFTKNKLLYIKELPDNKFEVSSMFYWIQDEDNVNLIAIVKYLISKSDDKYYFENYLDYSTKDWKNKSVGFIQYYYPKEYRFNLNKAKKANKIIRNLNKLFDLKETKISYYIAEDCDKQLDKLGITNLATTGLMDQCGYFDKENNILLSTFYAGENYRHEIIHLINKKFPKAHYLLLTGLSVYHNDENANLGRSMKNLMKDFSEYADQNKDYKFAFTGTFPKINNKSGTEYLIGFMLIDKILEVGGKDLLIEALNNIKNNGDLETFIIEKLKVTNEDQLIRNLGKNVSRGHFKFKIEL